MNLPEFQYLSPKNLDETLSLLKEKGGRARLLAGGSDLLVAMKQRRCTPEFLIDIRALTPLNSIRHEPSTGLMIGALTTLETISRSQSINRSYRLLAEAAGKVASSQIRNVGTLGGNICLNTRCWYYNQSEQWRESIPKCFKMDGDRCLVMKGSKKCNAIFVADTVPALLASDARLKIVNEVGERTITLADFFTGEGRTPNILRLGEVLTEVHIPKPPARSVGIFLKFAPREVLDFALVNIAMLVTFRQGGRVCEEARIVVGGVKPCPVRSVAAENVLKGEKITENAMEEVGNLVAKDSEPISPIWMLPSSKRELIKVLVKKGLGDILECTH